MNAREEHNAELDRDYWAWDGVVEVADERHATVKQDIASAISGIIQALEAGDTQPARDFLYECMDAAAKEESLDDVAWDWSQK